MAIGVVHLNKKNDLSVVQRILGASGLTNAPRSGWSVQKDDEDPTERLFLPLKWNYLPEGTAGLRFRIKHVGPWQQSVRCEWLGETAKRADEVMAATTSGEVSAPQWLIRYLQEHGETERDQVMKDAANAGFKEETIQKAKARKANILDNRVGWPGKSCWRLAE